MVSPGSFILVTSDDSNDNSKPRENKAETVFSAHPSFDLPVYGCRCTKKREDNLHQTLILAVLWVLLAFYLYFYHCHCQRRLELLERQLYYLPRDFTGRQDFASRYNGGHVMAKFTTQTRSSTYPTNDPIVALDEDLRLGRCWRFEGGSGQIAIAFSQAVQISDITVDHIPKELVSTAQVAPRSILAWGAQDIPQGHSALTLDAVMKEVPRLGDILGTRRFPPIHSDHMSYLPIALIDYDIHNQSHVQTFPIFASVTTHNMSFPTIVMEILSNWGGTSSCIYRIRVHGKT